MLRYHPSLPVLVGTGTLLQRPGLLEQPLLAVDHYLPLTLTLAVNRWDRWDRCGLAWHTAATNRMARIW